MYPKLNIKVKEDFNLGSQEKVELSQTPSHWIDEVDSSVRFA